VATRSAASRTTVRLADGSRRRRREVVQFGDLSVKILPAAVPALIAVLRSWAGRHQQHDMKVMIKVGDRAVELEYPVGTMKRDDVLNLVAMVTGAPADEPSEG
jgi:hypothetical protein